MQVVHIQPALCKPCFELKDLLGRWSHETYLPLKHIHWHSIIEKEEEQVFGTTEQPVVTHPRRDLCKMLEC